MEVGVFSPPSLSGLHSSPFSSFGLNPPQPARITHSPESPAPDSSEEPAGRKGVEFLCSRFVSVLAFFGPNRPLLSPSSNVGY